MPRATAFAALALLPAALACSSSRAALAPQQDETYDRSEARVVVIDRDDDTHVFGFGDGEGGSEVRITGDGDHARIHIRTGERELEVEKKGAVEVDDGTGLVTSLGPDARFSVEEVVGGERRRVVATAGPDGTPVHRYTVDGAARPFDASAQAWVRDALGSVQGHSAHGSSGGGHGRAVAMRMHHEGRAAHRESQRAHREAMRHHQEAMRAMRSVRGTHGHGRSAWTHDPDSSSTKSVTLRNGIMTAIDEDGEVTVINLDSLVSTSIGEAMRAIEEMDFDFDFDEDSFRFDADDFGFEFDTEMSAASLQEQADALEEAAAELRREAEALRREADAAAREAGRDD